VDVVVVVVVGEAVDEKVAEDDNEAADTLVDEIVYVVLDESVVDESVEELVDEVDVVVVDESVEEVELNVVVAKVLVCSAFKPVIEI